MKNRRHPNTRRHASPRPRLLLAALVLLQLLAFSAAAGAQTPAPSPSPSPAAPPATDIFVVEVVSRGRDWRFGRPRNVTGREGYDNQPHFTSGGEGLLYTSIREDRQADIYRFDLRPGGAHTRVTATAEDEYSPTVVPGGRFLSVVRVEADKTQRLWKFPVGGGDSSAASLVLEHVKPVGYHAWLDDDARQLALFVLGTPNTLQLADARTGKSEIIVGNVGRSLHLIPGRRAFSFVHKVSDAEWLIKSFDLRTRAVTTVAPTLPASEDYVWTPDGRALLMAKGSKLFMRRVSDDADWREVADFSSDGLKEITRLALSPRADRLALVARP